MKTEEDDEFERIERETKIAAGLGAFYGFPQGPVSSSNAGGKCVTDGETSLLDLTAENIEMLRRFDPKDARLCFFKPTHTLNSTKTVAVATDVYWLPIDADTPRSAKLQLLSIGGVAQYGNLQADTSFYTHWCPVPKKPK